MADTYRCKSAFAWFDKGTPRVVTPGMLVDGDDPAYKANPGAFESTGDGAVRDAKSRSVKAKPAPVVEQATAAPGEKRSRGRA